MKKKMCFLMLFSIAVIGLVAQSAKVDLLRSGNKPPISVQIRGDSASLNLGTSTIRAVGSNLNLNGVSIDNTLLKASDSTQTLNSNVSVAEGKQILFNDGSVDEALIGYHDYGGWTAVEVGAEEKGLTLNTYNRGDGTVNENILVNYKSHDGTEGQYVLPKKSQVDSLAVGINYNADNKLVTYLSGGTPDTTLIPEASSTQNGLMPAASFNQIDANTQAIGALIGAVSYLPANDFGSATPTQDTLNTYALQYSNPITNACIVLNTNNNHEWIYNLSNTTWIDNGIGTVNPATNTSLGIVKGSTVGNNGKVFVENDGSMSVIGFDGKADKVTATAGKGLATINSQGITTGVSAIANSDLPSDVQTSLGLANTAYQKPSTGILFNDMRNSNVTYSHPTNSITKYLLISGFPKALYKLTLFSGLFMPYGYLNQIYGHRLELTIKDSEKVLAILTGHVSDIEYIQYMSGTSDNKILIKYSGENPVGVELIDAKCWASFEWSNRNTPGYTIYPNIVITQESEVPSGWTGTNVQIN